jgi:P27 family predicted phage terminase small subunit
MPAKRVPTPLRVARGTHRKDRHGDPAAEPKIDPATLGEPPGHLLSDGVLAWRHVGPLLVGSGLLTEADVGPFTRYCEALDQARIEASKIEAEGADFTTEKGFVCQHPAVNRRFKWLTEIRKFEDRFGMSAANRSGMQIAGKGEEGVETRQRTG